jgi:tetratricopeptide (TPR) repeat protein
MSRVKDLKRQLEASREAIEALDADLAAGRLGRDEHGRRRAEREREAGRLFVDLRRAQRQSREREGEEPPRAAAPRLPRFRSPAIVLAAGLLLVIGIGAGLGVGRWFGNGQGPAAPAGPAVPAPAGLPAAMTPGIELEALRQLAAREDAPVATQLQLAHAALGQGRLDEARGIYERVLAREPRNAEAITHLGAVLFQEGRIDAALAKVEEALRIDPRYIHAHWDRTQYLFYGKRDFPAAAKAAEAFLKVTPEGPDADNIRKLRDKARQGAAGAAPLPPPAR